MVKQTFTIADVYHRIGTLEGEVTSLRETIVAQMKVQDDRVTKHDVRIGDVEKKQHWYGGAGAVLGTVAGLVASHLKW